MPITAGDKPRNRAEWRALRHQRRGLREFHDDAAGCFRLHVVRRDEMFFHLATSPKFRRAVEDWFAKADEMRPLCLDCDSELTGAAPPADWLVAVPLREDYHSVLTMGLCEGCSARLARDDALFAAAAARLRTAWPDLRMVDAAAISSEGGRA
jgi:hypothetical protein